MKVACCGEVACGEFQSGVAFVLIPPSILTYDQWVFSQLHNTVHDSILFTNNRLCLLACLTTHFVVLQCIKLKLGRVQGHEGCQLFKVTLSKVKGHLEVNLPRNNTLPEHNTLLGSKFIKFCQRISDHSITHCQSQGSCRGHLVSTRGEVAWNYPKCHQM